MIPLKGKIDVNWKNIIISKNNNIANKTIIKEGGMKKLFNFKSENNIDFNPFTKPQNIIKI